MQSIGILYGILTGMKPKGIQHGILSGLKMQQSNAINVRELALYQGNVYANKQIQIMNELLHYINKLYRLDI